MSRSRRSLQLVRLVGCRIAVAPAVADLAQSPMPETSPTSDKVVALLTEAGLNTILTGSATGFYPLLTATGASSCSTARPKRHFRRPPEEVLGHRLWETIPERRRATALGKLFRKTRKSRETAARRPSWSSSAAAGSPTGCFRSATAGYRVPRHDRPQARRGTARPADQGDGAPRQEYAHHRAVDRVAEFSHGPRRARGVVRAFDARLIALGNVHSVLTQAELGRRQPARRGVGGAAPAQRAGPRPLHRRRTGRSRSARNARSRSRWRCMSLPPTRSSTVHCSLIVATWTSRGAPRTIASTGNGASAAALRSKAPERTGFGSRMIERALALQLVGQSRRSTTSRQGAGFAPSMRSWHAIRDHIE